MIDRLIIGYFWSLKYYLSVFMEGRIILFVVLGIVGLNVGINTFLVFGTKDLKKLIMKSGILIVLILVIIGSHGRFSICHFTSHS